MRPLLMFLVAAAFVGLDPWPGPGARGEPTGAAPAPAPTEGRRVVSALGPYISKATAEQVAEDLRKNGYPPSKGFYVYVEDRSTPRRTQWWAVVEKID